MFVGQKGSSQEVRQSARIIFFRALLLIVILAVKIREGKIELDAHSAHFALVSEDEIAL